MSFRVSRPSPRLAFLFPVGLVVAAGFFGQGLGSLSRSWLDGPARIEVAPPDPWVPLDPHGTVELALARGPKAPEGFDPLELEVGAARVYRWSDQDWIVEVDCRVANRGPERARVSRELLAIEGAFHPWGPVTSFPELELAPGASITGTVGWYCHRDLPRPGSVHVTRVPVPSPAEADLAPGASDLDLPELSQAPLPAPDPDRGSVPPSGRPLETLAIGDPVLALWHDTWWRAHVLAFEPDGSVRVHYDGWEDTHDEAVDPSRLSAR